MNPFLDRILASKRREVEERKRSAPVKSLEKQPGWAAPRRGFRAAVAAAPPASAIISELKKASPSKGLLRADFDLEALCRAYCENGAAALSVLTEKEFFLGGLDNLRIAKDLCPLPALRKDFIVDEYQVYESRAAGADCILLIAAALGAKELKRLARAARDAELEILIEAHNREELLDALECEPDLVGVNNRDLHTFETRLETSVALAELMPPGTCAISESGIRTREHILQLAAAGYSGFLIGETLVTAPDPGAKLRELRG